MLTLITGIIPNTSDISAATKPKKPKITLKVDEKGSSVTVTIGKTKLAEGYQIMVKLPGAKKYTEIKILELNGKKKRTFTVDNLAAGNYSIKVRAYKNENGKKVWGKYSSVQTVTIEEKKGNTYSVGDIVMFGSYEQDGNLKNGKEPIEWIVLANEDSKLFMVSLFALEDGTINDIVKNNNSWEKSDMRKWLNRKFFKKSFTSDEAEFIADTELTDTGTTDKVFLLSRDEVMNAEYGFAEKKDRMCGATVYAENGKPDKRMKYVFVWKDATMPPYYVANREKLACFWWLRTGIPTSYEELHCHVFRHSIGMAMYKAGIPLPYIKDFLGHSSLDSTSIYAHADNEAMAEALRSVDQDALPVKDDKGNIISTPEKKWKGKEEYLIHFCGLG